MNKNNGNSRIVRYGALRPCLDAFIDTRTPGSDQKENFTIIGPGVSENPNQYIHIAEPHGFNIGGARQPSGCTNSQHSHKTAEVFYIHKGTWSFDLGEHGDEASIILRPGDLISIPTDVFRGFKNVGDDIGFLLAVLGEDNPGRVLWAPYVFDMAKEYGLVLLENGTLVDTGNGEEIPKGQQPMPVTSRAEVEALQKLTDEQLRECCVLADEEVLTDREGGVTRRKLIGAETKLNWDHGFGVDQISLESGASVVSAKSSKQLVVFVHQGELSAIVDGETWVLYAGDTATIPANVFSSFENQGKSPVDFLTVQAKE